MKQNITVEPGLVSLLMMRNASTDISWRECKPYEITVLMYFTGETIHDAPLKNTLRSHRPKGRAQAALPLILKKSPIARSLSSQTLFNHSWKCSW